MSNSTLQIVYTKENYRVMAEMTPEEIFDTNKYSELHATTFSIDKQFVEKYLTGFKRLDLIVGIPDFLVQKRAYDGISIHSSGSTPQSVGGIVDHINTTIEGVPITFFEGLSGKDQDRVLKNIYRIRVPLYISVHSKFYLLKSDTETRVIIGSANLSNQAFQPMSNQCETIMIFDNDFDLYEKLLSKFNEITQRTVDFFSQSLRKHSDAKQKKLAELGEQSTKGGKTEVNVHFSISEQSNIKEESILEYQEMVSQQLADKPEILTELKNQPMYVEAEKKELKKRITIRESSAEITNFMVNSRTKIPKPQYRVAFQKKVNQVLARKYVPLDKSLTRPEQLYSNPVKRDLNCTGLYQVKGSETIVETSYGMKANDEEIKIGLQDICTWIESYRKFTRYTDADYQSRVMESILYAFTSPFIHEIRKKIKNGREDVPQFMIIGGCAGSGKSKHLEFITKLMGLRESGKPQEYNTILPNNTHNWKAETINCLYGWMLENNVAPLLIDEVDAEFFENRRRGEELIVNVTNESVSNLDTCPCMICTTNSTNYMMEERARRRSYYLKQDIPFDKELKKQSIDSLEKSLTSVNDVLFQDFVVRFSDLLMDSSLDWNTYSGANNSGVVDFLFYTRKIFREYFNLAGIEIPEWFPSVRYNDTATDGINTWRNLYKVHHSDFKYDRTTDTLVYDVKNLNTAPLQKGSPPNSSKYLALLDENVKDKGASSQDIVVLRAKPFCAWIGVQYPPQTDEVYIQGSNSPKKRFAPFSKFRNRIK